MRTIIKLGATAAGLWVATWLLDGLTYEGGAGGFALVTAIVLGVNMFVRPVVKLLSLPVIIVTLGLFTFIVNALMLQLVVELSDPLGLGLSSEGFFWTTFLGAIVLSVVRTVIESVLLDD